MHADIHKNSLDIGSQIPEMHGPIVSAWMPNLNSVNNTGGMPSNSPWQLGAMHALDIAYCQLSVANMVHMHDTHWTGVVFSGYRYCHCLSLPLPGC